MKLFVAALAGAALVALVACASTLAAAPSETWIAADAQPPFPKNNPPTPMKIELGRRLFYDGDLSWDGTMSCATCHEQKRGFTDPNKTRPGFDGQPGERNIQTLANVGWFGSLTWGGPQVDTLEHQALIPIEGFVPVEMGFGGRPEGFAGAAAEGSGVLSRTVRGGVSRARRQDRHGYDHAGAVCLPAGAGVAGCAV